MLDASPFLTSNLVAFFASGQELSLPIEDSLTENYRHSHEHDLRMLLRGQEICIATERIRTVQVLPKKVKVNISPLNQKLWEIVHSVL